ncbi:DUF4157 domain-containing protein [Oscillatoriales cyanobacterium LEGE 11467]|uniref:DUF4157 domain-containing protein n=1 Tax=Zarconia navalis LEGE 11467 TaxID=1828826 RepID=A0A928VWB9_9CYAN|nr:DUF4157 domain-containing protein [Zarconia navalis]MBE9040488.1 DUF4157 domain-containing protein [Zarconia navalis LEGE 11467]
MTNSHKIIGYFGALLGCISLGLIAAPLIYQATEFCNYPGTFTGQLCRGKVPKQVPESAWAKAGAVGYQTSAQIIEAHNGLSQPLDETQKRYFRPHFGDLVDRVYIIYNAQLMDEWVSASFRIDLGRSNAQVYGNRIYLRDAYKPDDFDQLVLLAHELVHVRQYEQFGGLEEFGYRYFQEYKRADQSYKNNPLEQEAFEFEKQFSRWLKREMRQERRRERR